MKRAVRGFTLVELLVVIAIIGILVALSAAPRSKRARGGPAVAVHQQSSPIRPSDAQLRVKRNGCFRLGEILIRNPADPAKWTSTRTVRRTLACCPYAEEQGARKI